MLGKQHVLICLQRARGGQDALRIENVQSRCHHGRSGWIEHEKEANAMNVEVPDDGIGNSRDVAPGSFERWKADAEMKLRVESLKVGG